jgi:metallo-beta-lactamase class B
MVPKDRVIKDGDLFKLGEQTVRVYETPGHTGGTASYSFQANDGNKSYRALTIGGLGMNAVESSKQVEGYIQSVERMGSLIGSTTDPIQAHLSAHPFSNNLMEDAARLKTRRLNDPHPLVGKEAVRKQLQALKVGAVERLKVERQAGR